MGVAAGRGTAVNTGFAGIVALLLTALLFLGIYSLPDSHVRAMFMDRGPTQYFSVYFGVWCAVILVIKRSKLAIQRRSLEHAVIPENHEFVLTSQTADHVIRTVHAIADDPQRFIVFNLNKRYNGALAPVGIKVRA